MLRIRYILRLRRRIATRAVPMARAFSPKNTLIATLYTALVFGIFAFIMSHAVNWPHADDFVSIDWYNNIVNKRMFGLRYILSLHDASHPLAAQGLLSTTLFALAGINFKLLIGFDTLLVLSSALTLSYFLFRAIKSTLAASLGSLLLLVIFFHPLQISHFLWAFEMGWFLINFILIAVVVCIESSCRYSLPICGLLCGIGAFCSAQGSVLWVAVVLHMCLLGIRKHRYWILAFFAGFLLDLYYVSLLTPSDSKPLHFSDSPAFMVYYLQLLGALFSQRIHRRILGQGIIVFLFAAIASVNAARNHRSPLQRTSLVLISATLISLLQFGVGRFQYGVDWALGDFHMSTLLIPLCAGLIISSLDWASGAATGSHALKLVGFASCFYLLASIAYSIHFARVFARESKLRTELARHFACEPNAPPYLVYGFNLGLPNKDLYLRTIPLLQSLCKIPDSQQTRMFLVFPSYFEALATRRPETAIALDSLWEVYLLDSGLSHAIPARHPHRAEELLRFAISNAKTGSHYAPERLKVYEPVFLSLDQIDKPRQ